MLATFQQLTIQENPANQIKSMSSAEYYYTDTTGFSPCFNTPAPGFQKYLHYSHPELPPNKVEKFLQHIRDTIMVLF